MTEEKKYVNENQDICEQKQNETRTISDLGHGLLNAGVFVYKGVKTMLKTPANFIGGYILFTGKKYSVDDAYYDTIYGNQFIIPNDSKVLLFIGETGAGKTSTLNTIKNYLENVKYKDKFRWKMVDESKSERNSAESQTQHLSIYLSNNYTFIDTPGFNDTEGKSKDIQTLDEIKKLLDTKLDFINAVCFVVKSGDNRLTGSTKYVIDNVLGLFAKDVINNIYIIVTHCDDVTLEIPSIVSNHPILKEINTKKRVICISNTPYIKLPKPPNVYSNDDDSDDSDDSDSDSDPPPTQTVAEVSFTTTKKSLKKMFKQITKGNRVKTSLTKQVLKKKRLIIAHMNTLNDNIKKILAKTKILLYLASQDVKCAPIITMEYELIDADCYYTRCTKCKHNCHENCSAWYKGACEIINWRGNCTQCELGCKKKDHILERKKWTYKVVCDFSQTAQALNKLGAMLEIQAELNEMECQIYSLIGCIIVFNDEINQYALKPNKYTIEKYIDELIADEYNNERNEEVINFLKCLKKENVINKIRKFNNDLKNEGVIFADLDQKELAKHFKKIASVVAEEMMKNHEQINNSN